MKKELMSSRIRLASLPTPLEQINPDFIDAKIDIWFKRDDLTEFVGSGNKIRKLEYLLYEAKKLGADTVVTCGGIQSNHCRATAFAARRLGMKPVLFLRGTKPEKAQGNLFLNMLLKSEIHFITPQEYENREEIMAEYQRRSLVPDRVYLIPEGGSNIVGSLGYIRAVGEMAEQTDLDFFDAIFCPVGSGGTYAGLLAGLKMNKLNKQLIGINVTLTDHRDFEQKIRGICDEYLHRSLIDERIQDDDIKIIDGYCGEAYAVPTDKGLSYIQSFMLHTGILLDPVYTSKAFDGMIEESKKHGFKRVLFLHSGGGFGNFAYSGYFGV
ncbi:MAG: 1-aminocyclopropane-1-carboxylate deaminase/D-cysteine desulfhydrase [Thermotogota bacterium]